MGMSRWGSMLAIMVVSVSGVQASEGIELSVSHDGGHVAEPNTVVVTLSNASDHEVFAYRDHSALSKPQGRLTGAWFNIVDSFGREVSYKGRWVYFGAPSPSAFIGLSPGESVSVSVDLSREYELPPAGEITVSTKVAVYDRIPKVLDNGESESLPYRSIASDAASFFVANSTIERSASISSAIQCTSEQVNDTQRAIASARVISKQALDFLGSLY